VPLGKYYFLEMYCPDSDCDCRKVDIIVYGEDDKVHATLTFGWEDKAYYTNHFGFESSELPGPDFSPMQFNGPFAKFFLKEFSFNCYIDKRYVDRLKRHYQMIKEKAKKEDLCQNLRSTSFSDKEKIGRNELCFCGSQKKYKHCCMKVFK
ncbi:SEC-C domain-containing protein, partial [Candidatus Gottesmanbacteria bacterium]|nr:SEC-C domain-containing protein [Candidatus Gottesmanbacteria bacterium]